MRTLAGLDSGLSFTTVNKITCAFLTGMYASL